jgi:capsular exopolysaccharide synthesis family protein
MSRIYEALRRTEFERRSFGAVSCEPQDITPIEFLQSFSPQPVDLHGVESVKVAAPRGSRLAALTDPQGLGAEQFRALATRLEHLRQQRDLKSLQVTSGGPYEGKTLLTINLAVTFAQNSRSRVLMIEGDLHRPTMSSLLGLGNLPGISRWWSGSDREISPYICKFSDRPLWLLPAGAACPQPSNILRSPRFAEALFHVDAAFDWVIVDSPPLLPLVDANLWSRLIDGTLLVVREGVASASELKKGLQAMDCLNLLGVVLNDASDCGHGKYEL